MHIVTDTINVWKVQIISWWRTYIQNIQANFKLCNKNSITNSQKTTVSRYFMTEDTEMEAKQVNGYLTSPVTREGWTRTPIWCHCAPSHTDSHDHVLWEMGENLNELCSWDNHLENNLEICKKCNHLCLIHFFCVFPGETKGGVWTKVGTEMLLVSLLVTIPVCPEAPFLSSPTLLLSVSDIYCWQNLRMSLYLKSPEISLSVMGVNKPINSFLKDGLSSLFQSWGPSDPVRWQPYLLLSYHLSSYRQHPTWHLLTRHPTIHCSSCLDEPPKPYMLIVELFRVG